MCYNFIICYSKKCFDCVVETAANENNGSSGAFIGDNLILPFKQHIPGTSFLNFNTLRICADIMYSILDTSYIFKIQFPNYTEMQYDWKFSPIDLMDSFVRTTIDCCRVVLITIAIWTNIVLIL